MATVESQDVNEVFNQIVEAKFPQQVAELVGARPAELHAATGEVHALIGRKSNGGSDSSHASDPWY